MFALIRAAAFFVAAGVVVGPLSAAAATTDGATKTAPAVAQATAPPAQTNATISGTVKDTTGAPIPGALLTATAGSTSMTAVTDGAGAYSLSLPEGVYELTAAKAGFSSASLPGLALVAGQVITENVSLQAITFTSLKQIGHVSVSATSGFNTSAAAVNIVPGSIFQDQGQLSTQHIFDETPGIVAGHPGTSANDASPGNIVVPNIRGGLSFETASLIDGHPLAVEDFGDYVTTFLNPYMLQDFELVKGPGATLPEDYYAVNGAVNFRTLDPTRNLVARVDEGIDSYGGLFSNYRISDTVLNHKLGFVLDYAIDGTPGPLNNASAFSTLSTSVLINGAKQSSPFGSAPLNGVTVPGGPVSSAGVRNNDTSAYTSLVYCCETITTDYDNKSELAKLRFNFSNSTVATLSYLGSQTWTDQNGNHAYTYSEGFTPAASYISGSPASGTLVPTYQNAYPIGYFELNNEPIFQAEIRSTVFGDTVLARYYAASIDRLQFEGSTGNITIPETLYGSVGLTAPGATTATPTTFNGQTAQVTLPSSYSLYVPGEIDKLQGLSLEYIHSFGAGNSFTVSYDDTNTQSDSHTYECCSVPLQPGTTVPVVNPPTGTATFPYTTYSIYPGSGARYSTILGRLNFNPIENLNILAADYLDNYESTFSDTGGASYKSREYWHSDPRLALTYRANRDISIRASTGASLAPPYLNILTSGTPTYSADKTTGAFATDSQNTGNLAAETAFGYDVGADFRLGDGYTVVSTDAYLNNVYNQFVSAVFANGTIPCSQITSGACAAGLTSVPLYTTTNVNLSNARYQGIELSTRRDPPVGFGFTANLALLQAYPYNISPCIYSTTVTTTGKNCAIYSTNLGIVPGINYLSNGPSGSSSYNAVSNTAIPYSQAYLEAHFRTPRGGYVAFGEQYLGPNNSYNEPAFFVAQAEARFPFGAGVYGQVSAYNLFNIYSQPVETEYGGVAVPLVNGTVGLTNGNTVGPRTFQFLLTKTFTH